MANPHAAREASRTLSPPLCPTATAETPLWLWEDSSGSFGWRVSSSPFAVVVAAAWSDASLRFGLDRRGGVAVVWSNNCGTSIPPKTHSTNCSKRRSWTIRSDEEDDDDDDEDDEVVVVVVVVVVRSTSLFRATTTRSRSKVTWARHPMRLAAMPGSGSEGAVRMVSAESGECRMAGILGPK